MRKGVLIFLIINIIVVGVLVHNVWTLLELLVVDGSEDRISRAELPAPNSGAISERPQLIPKIIHQTYINESIPQRWQEAQKSCIDLHEDYEYKLWTDKKAREFIADEYPWFLETFDGYEFPIQRADSIRYFVLAHFGGIYIDLDDGCNRRLDPLLSYPAWLRRTVPTGVSNDAMGAVPRHPFFLKVIDALPRYNRNWLLPYITVMGSTGPLFLSVIWRHYNNEGPAEDGRIRILFGDEYNNHPWSFFTHHVGNSWHGGDVKLIFWVRRIPVRFVWTHANLFLDGSSLVLPHDSWFRHWLFRHRSALVDLPLHGPAEQERRPRAIPAVPGSTPFGRRRVRAY